MPLNCGVSHAALHRGAGPVPASGVPPQSTATRQPGGFPAHLPTGLQLPSLCGGGGGRDEEAASGGLISTAEGVKVRSGHLFLFSSCMYCTCVGRACVLVVLRYWLYQTVIIAVQFTGCLHKFIKTYRLEWVYFIFSLFGLSKEEHGKHSITLVLFFLFRKKILVSFVRSWLFTLVPHSKPNAGPFAPQHT